ncbi:site-specific integrase [Paraburkholderia megapolitana]|uniref:Site-specific recombinase XerD n=1 Tax=Paraburkholderia megapolitana TaxID=420953 RepID=A0A1I3VWD8_9BURK|nr:site-specific integrase [Paraburkholderia megapolitana]QDQ82266.1 tyrosine-type recombinase/integrase [Paraburkholderia megapolitana]SFJ99545.1 Site-specific recombinase XerD [Paraburkholderia megapolitana]
MSNRAQQLELPPPRTYTRTDFAALRAYVQRIQLPTIARLYFDPDTTPYEDDPAALERYLRTMRDDLVHLAMLNGSSVLAEHLKVSIRQHGSAKLTRVSLRMVEDAARLAAAAPAVTHAVGLWFRPLVAKRLIAEGIATLGDLIAFCNRRGGSWWRSVPRIGLLRARVLVVWLRRHEASLGVTVASDVNDVDPLVIQAAPATSRVTLVPAGTVSNGLARAALAPLERVDLPLALSGATGTNRASGLCYLHAKHDIDAIRAYLNRYVEQRSTLLAYTRELERLLLWSVTVRGTALASLNVEDCEAYKAFLASPGEDFKGPPVSRASGRWRPFAPGGLSLSSQRYATRALRAAFDWFVDVRYLAGNPWRAVRDPRPVKRATAMKIERALPATLWASTRVFVSGQCEGDGPDAPRWRAAHALQLLMGDSGLRVAEAAAATRDFLQHLPADGDMAASWQLGVIGKGDKERIVPASAACVAAIAAHWADRGEDFGDASSTRALIAPLVIPPTPRAQRKFGPAAEEGADGEHEPADGAADRSSEHGGYSVRGARGLIAWMTRELLKQMPDLSESQRVQLTRTSPHAFRHTFGTQTVASGVPLDVTQRLMGHASVQTTTVYVTAEQQRMRREMSVYFGKLDPAPAVEPVSPVTPELAPSLPGDGLSLPQVQDDASMQTATVLLSLHIENNSKFVRGRKRVIEHIERWILEDYEAHKLSAGEYELKVPYETDDELGDLMAELLDEIQAAADDRHCYSSSEARLAGSDRIWD